MPKKIKTIGISSLLLLAAGLGGGKAFVDYQLNHYVNSQMHKYFEHATVGHVHLSLLGSLLIEQIQINTAAYPPLSIAQVRIAKAYQYYWQPHVIQVIFKEVSLSLTHYETSIPLLMKLFGYAAYSLDKPTLQELGYIPLHAPKMILTAQRKEAQQLQLKLDMDIVRLGQLTIVAHLMMPTQSITTLNQSQLIELNLSYLADKMLDDIFTHLAQRNKMTVSELKQNLIAQLHQDLNRAKVHADILKGLAAFIQTPKQFMIQLQPRSPISITEMTSTDLTQWHLTSN